METKITHWADCYDSSLKGLLVPAAFAHPAKMARGLTERIYAHGAALGYWKPGDWLVDPFGGVGTTGLIGAYRGYKVIGCELEPKFVALGNQNIDRHRQALAMLGHPAPLHVQGDSRELGAVVAAAIGVATPMGAITSPPYADSVNNAGKGGIDWNKAGRPDRLEASAARHGVQGDMSMAYGVSAGQLGAMDPNAYWVAVAAVYRHLFELLPAGGAAAVVVKDYVKNKTRFLLCDQTAELLAATGFNVSERCHASLVKTNTQPTLFGVDHTHTTDRKSFWRRLHEKKGSPAINYEVVIWAVKPTAGE